jgi:hypothetical protein
MRRSQLSRVRIRLVDAYEQLPDYEDEQRSWEELSAAEMAKAVDSRVRALGSDHPDTLTLRYRLAFLRLHLDDDFEALRDALKEIAEERVRVLGAAHPDTLESWEMLGRHCPELELDRPITQGWEQVLADREERLGPDHPETLDAAVRLGLRHRVIAGWERIAAERARRLGPLHPDALEAREEHLRFVEAYDGSEAGRLLREAVAGEFAGLFGADHPETLRAQIRVLGHETPTDTARAEELIGRAYGILGAADGGFLRLRHLLMVTHLTAGRDEAALEVGRRYPSPSDDDHFVWEGRSGAAAE